MSAPSLNVVIFGATGYIGGSILTLLLDFPNLSISVLVRSAVKAQKLRALNLGINVLEGSPTSDAKIVEALLLDADLVIDAYDLNDVVGTTNVIEGLKKSSKTPRVIHVSGLGVLRDFAQGKSPQQANYVPYDDTDLKRIAALPQTGPNRIVDLKFQEADEQGHILSYIVLPGAIFGPPKGILVDAGIVAAQEIIIKLSVQPIKALGGAVALTVGEGLNLWPVVEIHECIDLVMLIIKKLLSPEWESVPHGTKGYYFAENGTVEMKQLALTAARIFSGQANPEHRPFTQEEMDKVFPFAVIPDIIGSNTGGTATRSRLLGWKPIQGPEEFLNATARVAQSLVEDN